MTVMCVGNSDVTLMCLSIVSFVLPRYMPTCSDGGMRYMVTWRHSRHSLQLRGRVRRWLVLTCCWWRNSAPVLIKSGAWSDKAETEVQRRDKTRGRRDRQGKMACVCKCFTTAVVLHIVYVYCTDVPGGGQSRKRWKRRRERNRRNQRRIRRSFFFDDCLCDRSMVTWSRTHMASVVHLTSGRRGALWAGRGS